MMHLEALLTVFEPMSSDSSRRAWPCEPSPNDSEIFEFATFSHFQTFQFSLIFSLAQVLLFNHGDGVLNSSETVESLELYLF